MNKHEKIDYLEYPSRSLEETKVFFSSVFNWHFTDYGAEYTAFDHQGVEGGFYQANLVSRSEAGAALTVFYSDDLETTMQKIIDANGVIIKPIFEFPGGKRFHFTEPGGNEFAVWTKF